MNNESIETLTSAFREAMHREMSERTKRGMRPGYRTGGTNSGTLPRAPREQFTVANPI